MWTWGRAMGVAWWEMIGYTLFWLKKNYRSEGGCPGCHRAAQRACPWRYTVQDVHYFVTKDVIKFWPHHLVSHWYFWISYLLTAVWALSGHGQALNWPLSFVVLYSYINWSQYDLQRCPLKAQLSECMYTEIKRGNGMMTPSSPRGKEGSTKCDHITELNALQWPHQRIYVKKRGEYHGTPPPFWGSHC